MTSTTKQFIWKDRDTAAHDLLQLAYFAPPSIAQSALSLLGAIRSPSVVPQLTAIVEDHERNMWQRIYALRSITHTPGDWYLSQLREEMIRILQQRAAIIAKHPHPDRTYLSNDLLNDICGLAACHPKNRDWFFSALDETTNPDVVCNFLTMAINTMQPEEFREILIDYLLKFLTLHPKQIDLSVIHTLVFEDNAKSWVWLHQNVDKIVGLLALDITNRITLSIAEHFKEARARLTYLVFDFVDEFNAYLAEIEQCREDALTRRKEHLSDYYLSSAYKHLSDLYQRADNNDKQAFQQLVRIARKWQGNIPLRAVATHMLGKLRHKYKVTDILCYLLKYAEDDWGNDISPLSPIRVEAGEALKDMSSPQVWEEMIDAFFINPANVLSNFMLDWISHVTDILDGLSIEYAGVSFGAKDQRHWFRALAEISEEQFRQEVSSM